MDETAALLRSSSRSWRRRRALSQSCCSTASRRQRACGGCQRPKARQALDWSRPATPAADVAGSASAVAHCHVSADGRAMPDASGRWPWLSMPLSSPANPPCLRCRWRWYVVAGHWRRWCWSRYRQTSGLRQAHATSWRRVVRVGVAERWWNAYKECQCGQRKSWQNAEVTDGSGSDRVCRPANDSVSAHLHVQC